jgi:hypothetical protein
LTPTFIAYTTGVSIGITEVAVFRITKKTDGTVQVHHKTDAREKGWLLRPVLPTRNWHESWKAFHGRPCKILAWGCTKNDNKDTLWEYSVMDTEGAVSHYSFPAVPLPIHANKVELLAKLLQRSVNLLKAIS